MYVRALLCTCICPCIACTCKCLHVLCIMPTREMSYPTTVCSTRVVRVGLCVRSFGRGFLPMYESREVSTWACMILVLEGRNIIKCGVLRNYNPGYTTILVYSTFLIKWVTHVSSLTSNNILYLIILLIFWMVILVLGSILIELI